MVPIPLQATAMTRAGAALNIRNELRLDDANGAAAPSGRKGGDENSPRVHGIGYTGRLDRRRGGPLSYRLVPTADRTAAHNEVPRRLCRIYQSDEQFRRG